MNRRQFLAQTAALAPLCSRPASAAEAFGLRHPRQVEFTKWQLGLFLHFT